MQHFTNAELERLKTYIDMARDLNTYRGYRQHIKNTQAAMNDEWKTANVDFKEHLQQELEAYRHAERTFPQHLQDTYGLRSPLQLETRMRAIENDLYPRVVEHSPMRDTFETMFPQRKEHRIQEWKTPARTPEEQTDRTVQYAKEAMQAEQEYRRQHGTPAGDDTHGPPVLERRLMDDAFERQYEKQPPAQGLSQEELNRQNAARTLDAQYGIGEAQKLNEQKLDAPEPSYEERFLRPSKQPRPRDPERSGPER